VNRVLVVDDDLPLRRTLDIGLRARGYDVVLAATGEDALSAAAQRPPDIVILDLGLPGMNGIEVAKALREWTDAPIVVLSARGAESVKIAALDAGADDYVTKPFGMGELLARLRASLRRTQSVDGDPIVRTPDFTVDLAAKTVTTIAGPVRLTRTEWEILEVLARNPERLVMQEHLLTEVWGPNHQHQTHYLRIYLRRLRSKLEPEPSQPRYLITESGMGYRLVGVEQ
jgi:two-component system KDP operon response regulator KdpE